jgi:asparagine synthase (glutamine-hydrolysing)
MSGIAGIIRFDGAPVEPGLVEKMTSAMSHRGPDGIHHWVKGSVALGQCMLCTTPESLEEKQPLTNEDETLVLVMDGRVDNWEELRKELLGRGARLRDRSDAELVLRSYEMWGKDCLAHIDGDFAFVVWDARRRVAFCARDRMGNKPFNYHWDGRTLAFSSELHAILALPWVKRELNEGVLAEFLGNEWYSRDETFWTGVMRLPARHRMHADAAGPRKERYWDPDLFAVLSFRRDDEYVEHYRELFAAVVRRMSRSHLPAAFEVSGGLDSSAIFAVAETLRRADKLPAPAIAGYTLDFTGDPDADEMTYARAVGSHLGIRLHEIPPAHRPLEWYREGARQYGEFPGYPNGTMALTLRERVRGDGSRVLLAGEGGDEWLGPSSPGHYYAEELAASHWRTALACARTDVEMLGPAAAARWFIRSGVIPLLPEPVKALGRSVKRTVRADPGASAPGLPRAEDWLTPVIRASLDQRRSQYCSGGGEPPVHHRSQRLQLLAFHDGYAASAREAEERSMASQGLELRLPFHDPKIVQFALSTPERLRSLGRSTKRLHRRAMRDALPGIVLERMTKADFMCTFRKQVDECEAELVSGIPQRRQTWVRPDLVASQALRRREAALAGRVEWWLWTLAGCDALMYPV